MRHQISRFISVTAIAAVSIISAGPAWAHVSIKPATAEQGGFATFAVQVPNEREASTSQVQVVFPADHPIAYVSVQPVPGWTVTVEKATLTTPLEAEGGEISEVVSSITWTGGKIGPGQFQQFLISAGPLPTDTDMLEFKAIQTYENGEIVRWIEPTPASGEEPEKPAPTLELTASSGDAHGGDTKEAASSTSDNDSNVLGIIAVVVAGLALVTGVAAFSRAKGAKA